MEQTENHRYAGFWIRAVAQVIDEIALGIFSSIFVWVLERMLVGAVFWFQKLRGVELPASIDLSSNGLRYQIAVFSLYCLISILYYVLGTAFYGTTLGKRVFSVYVVRTDNGQFMTFWQSALRYFATILSALPLGAGLMMAGMHPQKRALHDLIAGTICVFRKKQA